MGIGLKYSAPSAHLAETGIRFSLHFVILLCVWLLVFPRSLMFCRSETLYFHLLTGFKTLQPYQYSAMVILHRLAILLAPFSSCCVRSPFIWFSFTTLRVRITSMNSNTSFNHQPICLTHVDHLGLLHLFITTPFPFRDRRGLVVQSPFFYLTSFS